MKIAIVASSLLPEVGRLERRVDRLARGLAERGAEVEILTQGPVRASVQHLDGVTTRVFSTGVRPLRFAVAPRLRDWLRTNARGFDVVDVHSRQAALALTVAGAPVRRLVLTPCASSDGLLSGRQPRATRAMLAAAPRIVCRSELERDLLCASITPAAGRVAVVPDGIDVEAIRSAEPFDVPHTVVLAVDRLDRANGVRRAIAAMATLNPEFRLVIVGDGPAREGLRAFADDLRVSSRVQFAGAVSDADLHRWLRTARVVVSLPGERSSGTAVTEACSAGVSVVTSDLPIQRHAAERVGGGVIFVPPSGSPLDVADAIEEASQLSVIPHPEPLISPSRSWDAAIDATWDVYAQMDDAPQPSERQRARHLVGLRSPFDAEGARTSLGRTQRASGALSWGPGRGRAANRVSGEHRWR